MIAYLPRHDPRDLIVFNTEQTELKIKTQEIKADFKSNAKLTIGTSSPRRAALIKKTFPNAILKDLRGNVDTRLSKLDQKEYDAIILAKAALDRLELVDKYNCVPFSIEAMTPCGCQGIIAIEALDSNQNIPKNIFDKINCSKTREAAVFERGILEAIEASCTTPIGVYTDLETTNVRWQKPGELKDWSEKYEGLKQVGKIGKFLLL